MATATVLGPAPAVQPSTRKRRSVPAVSLYSVHAADCKYKGKSRKISCLCPKQLRYYQNGKEVRIAIPGIVDSEQAMQAQRNLQAQLEAIAKGETPKSETKKGRTLEEAIEVFLDAKETQHAGGELTLKHCNRLRCELEHFRDYCAGLGLLALAAIESEHVLAYKNSVMKAAGEKGRETARKRMGRLTGFFSFCMNDMPWITRNPARGKLISIRSKKTHEPKALTDAQFEQALAVIPKLNGRTTAEIRAKLRSLFLLMKWTGLAIRDALTTVERSDFRRVDESFYTLRIKRAKTDNVVFCTLEAPLVEEIFAAGNPTGRYLFVPSAPTTERGLNNLVHQWGTLFTRVSSLAKLVDEHGEPYPFTSHSMRHTFVFWCLNHDITTEDIAMLIGDSVEVVAKYYSVWIHGRQERLTQRMVEALKNKPSKA